MHQNYLNVHICGTRYVLLYELVMSYCMNLLYGSQSTWCNITNVVFELGNGTASWCMNSV